MSSSTRLIAELGSCHMGNFDRIREAIDRCKLAGIDALKLQLFPNDEHFTKSGNVWLDPDMFIKAFEYAKVTKLELSASAFDVGSFNLLLDRKVPFIKLAYSQKHRDSWTETCHSQGIEAIVSCDVMSDRGVNHGATKLYCIPEYPVRYEVCFDELFPRFDGFSDHTLGTRQTRRAIEAGAKVIEKHVRLGYADETCPDAHFAVTIEEFGRVQK